MSAVFRNLGNFFSVSFLLLCLLGTARGLDSRLVLIDVNVYNDAKVSSVTMRRAEERAGRVLQLAGVHVLWNDGQPSRNPSLSEPQGNPAAEFSLRIVPHSRNLADSVFGVSFLGTDNSGRYGDIFYAAAERLSETAHINLGDVLGHVIAHELGHLLLGTNAHSPQGIMRPHWSSEELHSLAMGRLLFTPEQAQSIRDRATQPLTAALTR